MQNIKEGKTLADISIIIKMMPEDMRQKISKKFIEFVEKNKDKEYQSNINEKIPLEKQKLDKDTKTMLALIYRDYLCNEEERERILKEEDEKIKKSEEENRNKYQINFQKKENLNEKQLAEFEKERLFKRIINFIKGILK